MLAGCFVVGCKTSRCFNHIYKKSLETLQYNKKSEISDLSLEVGNPGLIETVNNNVIP